MLRLSANLGFLWKGLSLPEAVRRAKLIPSRRDKVPEAAAEA